MSAITHHADAYALEEPNQDILGAARLLIDARKLYDGGIGTYTRNLVDGVLRYTKASVGLVLNTRDFIPVSWHSYRSAGRLQELRVDLGLYSVRELVWFAKQIDWDSYDLLHVPHFTVPFGIPIPVVVTIHDLIHIEYPERWYYPYLGRWYVNRALQKAAAVITVSRATKHKLKQSFGVRAQGVRCVPNAIASSLCHRTAIAGIKPGFLLSVFSNAKPHKGKERLLQAYAQARRESEDLPSLVLVGGGAVGSCEVPGVLQLGRVSDEQLAWCYANARALVVASREEGFCLPVLEAHAAGTPVVTTPVPAVQELLTAVDSVSSDFSSESLATTLLGLVSREKRAPDADAGAAYDLAVVTAAICGVYQGVLR